MFVRLKLLYIILFDYFLLSRSLITVFHLSGKLLGKNVGKIAQCSLSLSPENIRKSYGFPMLSWGRERMYWERMG